MLQEPSLDLPAPDATPRASLVADAADIPGLRCPIWMGGARSLRGEPLALAALQAAWLVDCAGDMPALYRTAAAAHLPCVFADLEALTMPSRYILAVVDRLTDAVTSVGAPAAVYVMCTHGMNRSGLIAGLLLRRLGLDAETALARIRTARPGALSNGSFVDLLRRA